MKKFSLLLFVAALTVSTSLSAQLPDSCAAPTLVRSHYLGSAKMLALRQMLGHPVYADSVQIPKTLYEPILEALSAVYNATQFAQRDTVTNCLDILAFPAPVSPLEITLTADTNQLWAQRLYQDISPTSNDQLDSLIFDYGLQRTSSLQIGGQYIFTFQTDQPLNTVALAALFNGVPGAQATTNTVFGGGSDIVLDTVAGGVTLTYTVRWGDCPAGCIYHRSWTFLVRPNCSVDYLGVEGDPLTQEVGCSSIFGCATEPLCLPWLQDSLPQYLLLHPDCLPSLPSVVVNVYQTFNTNPVIGIHVFIGIDAQFTDFFNCEGQYLGTCAITIGGPGCMPENLSHYLQGDTIWDCTQALPTPANCGVTATAEPGREALRFQISPNPSSTGQVMLRADLGTRSKGLLSVFNIFGETILQKTFDTAELDEPLVLAGQSPGMYFVRLDAGGRTGTRKLLLLP